MVGMDERMTPADSPALEADASFERFDAGRATPAALVSGEVAATALIGRFFSAWPVTPLKA